MSWNKRDFLETMNRGKDAAMRDRNRGHATGKAAAGWIRTQRAPGEWTSDEIASAYGLLAVELAIEDHYREVYPERYIPF